MKKLLPILFTIFLCSGLGNSFVFAHAEKGLSDQIKAEKILFVELFIPDEELGEVSHKFKVPNDFNFEKELIGGGWETVDCTKCSLTVSYSFFIFNAEKIKIDQTKITIGLTFRNKPKCGIDKEITINQSKKETTKLKCGVEIVTFYAPENEDK